MIFKIYDYKEAQKIFTYCYVITNILLILISTFGFFSGVGNLATISGIFYLTLSTLLTQYKKFIDSPFSILFCFSTLVFFNIPAAFILVEGENYKYGDGLASVPYSNNDYAQNLWLGFLYLFILWLSVWSAIVSIEIKKNQFTLLKLSEISNTRILALGFIVIIFTWFDNVSIISSYIEKVEKLFNVSSFIFFDHAYLLITGIIILFKINQSISFNNRILLSGSIIFFSFLMLSFLSGSKGAILMLFIFLILIPFSFSKCYFGLNVFGPTKSTCIALIILAPIIFYLALIQRINIATGIEPAIGNFFADGIFAIELDAINEVLIQILYRLSWGGLDRFLLLFQSFIFEDFNFLFTIHFLVYLIENALNLLLPSTPFSDAYYPSSQFFGEVLSKKFFVSDGGYVELISSLNTQAYTIFGIFIILFGIFSPVFLYVFSLILLFVFKQLNGSIVRVSILYFWLMAISSYGIEVVVVNSIHLYLSMWLMYILVRKYTFVTPLLQKN